MGYTAPRLAVALLLWLVLFPGSGCTPPPAADGKASETPESGPGPYAVWSIPMRRGPPELLRVDSATGSAWSKGLMEGGPWLALPETPGHEPEPGGVGRYDFRAIALRRGAPNLIRTDTESGKVWRKGVKSGGPWVPIPDEFAEEPAPTLGVPGEQGLEDTPSDEDDYTQMDESDGSMEPAPDTP